MTKVLTVEGMMCTHCQGRVEKALAGVKGVKNVTVDLDAKTATVLKSVGNQFALDGTQALETPALWEVPEIKAAGGLDALAVIGKPVLVMKEAKQRLFAA